MSFFGHRGAISKALWQRINQQTTRRMTWDWWEWYANEGNRIRLFPFCQMYHMVEWSCSEISGSLTQFTTYLLDGWASDWYPRSCQTKRVTICVKWHASPLCTTQTSPLCGNVHPFLVLACNTSPLRCMWQIVGVASLYEVVQLSVSPCGTLHTLSKCLSRIWHVYWC